MTNQAPTQEPTAVAISPEVVLRDLKQKRLLSALALASSVLALLSFQVTGAVLIPLVLTAVFGKVFMTNHAKVDSFETRLGLESSSIFGD